MGVGASERWIRSKPNAVLMSRSLRGVIYLPTYLARMHQCVDRLSLARFPSEKSGTMILVTGEMGAKGGGEKQEARGFIEMQELRRYVL